MTDQLPFVVEPMSLADLDQVIAIERVAFSAPWSVHAYRYEILKNAYSTMLVGRQAPATPKWLELLPLLKPVRRSPVLSYGGFWLLVDDAHISTIAVDTKWQGRGLGELIFVSLLDEGAKLGAQRATLEVRVSNLPAQGLYQKYGFRTVSRQKRYYADNNEDAYIMVTPPFESPEFQANLNHRRGQLHERLRTAAYHLDGLARSQETLS
jgi:ribosomal-protein-alanine N-acetyltransferase